MDSNTRKIKIGLGAFDLVKGFAIAFMVIGHMASHYAIDTLSPALYVFFLPLTLLGVCTIPMFFTASGFGFKEKSPGKMLKMTFSDLLKPYLFITLAVALVYPISYGIQKGEFSGAIPATARWVLALLFGLHDPYADQKILFGIEVRACWVAWFLLAMFVAFNVLNLILKAKKSWAQFALVIFSVVSGYVLSRLKFTYFCIPQGLIAVGYCYIGFMFKKHKFFEREAFPVRLCIVLIPITLIECVWGDYDMAYNIYKYGLLDIVAASCAGIFLFVLGAYAGRCEWKWLNPIKQIGVYTYWIMCIHSVELICFPWDRIVKSMPEYPFVAFLIELGSKLVLISVCCIVLKKITQYRYRRKMNALRS